VATTGSTVKDSDALEAIHARLAKRGLLPGEHLADGGYVTVNHLHAAAEQQVTLIGPIGNNSSWQHRANAGFSRAEFTIDFEHREATCPQGETSGDWLEMQTPGRVPSIVVKFDRRLCDPYPVRTSCTRSREGHSISFPPRHLYELQERNREQQTDSHWLRTYGSRSGVEGTVAEFVGSHRVRHCRYHGLAKTHVQHVLTAVAVNIEQLHTHETPAHHAREPTALQKYIIGRELPIPHWWGDD